MTTNRTTTTTKNAIIMILAALALMLAPTALAADPVTIGMAGAIAYDGTSFTVSSAEPGLFTQYDVPDYAPTVDHTHFVWTLSAPMTSPGTYSGPIEVCELAGIPPAVDLASCTEVGQITIAVSGDFTSTTISGEVTPTIPTGAPTLPTNLYGPFAFSETFEYLLLPGMVIPLEKTFSTTIPDPDVVVVDDNWSTNAVGDLIDNQYLIGYNAFSTIEDAVAKVATGGTVTIMDGTYQAAPLTIDKELSLIGTGNVLVDASSVTDQYFWRVTADNVLIQGMMLDAAVPQYTAWPPGNPRYGITLIETSSVTLSDLQVTGFGISGINLFIASDTTINNVRSADNGGAGIFSKNSQGLVLQDITTENNPWGGIGISTDANNGAYSPSDTSGVIFLGTNDLAEGSSADNGGIYLESERGGDAITYGFGMGYDVDLSNTGMEYALHGPQDDAPTTRSSLYATLEAAEMDYIAPYDSAYQTGPNHFLDEGRWIERLSDGNLIVTDSMSIQDAIDAAGDGDTIIIGDGVFDEGLLIDKSLTIIGDGASNTTTLYLYNTSGYCSPASGVCITADGVHFEGFHLIGSPSVAGNSRALKVQMASDVVLKDLIIEDAASTGLDIIGTENTIVNDVAVLDAGGAGMFLKNNLGLQLLDVTTSGNPWGGIGIGTDGAYTQDATTVTFDGENVLMEGYTGGAPGLYLEQYREGETISYGYAGSEDVVLTGTNLTYVVHGFTHPDALVDWQVLLYSTYDAAAAAYATFGATYVENLDDGSLHLPDMISVKEPYPMNETYVFSCLPFGEEADSYDWNLGDGAFVNDINASEIMHSYNESDTYTVYCGATVGNVTYTDTLEIEVTVPEAPQPPASLNMYVKPPFPKKNHVVLQCQPHNFEPLGIDYNFGDGEKLYDVENLAVYHKYETAGEYVASCVASDGNITLVDWVSVNITEAPEVDLLVSGTGADYEFTCDATGFSAAIEGYDWNVWSIPSGEQVYGPVYDNESDTISVMFTENGPYMASCTATSDGETRIATKRFAVTEAAGAPGPDMPASSSLEVMLQGNKATLVVPNLENLSDIRITAPSSVKQRYVDLTAMLNEQNGHSAYLPMSVGFLAATDDGNVDVMLPAGMTIYGTESWDGILELPTAKNAPGLTGKRVSAVIKIGSSEDLLFDKGVRILFHGKGGEDVGILKAGELTEITTACSEDTQTAADTLPAGGDCKITVGDDLVVWTKHFTEFVTYTDEPTRTSSGGGSSRGITSRGGGFNWFRSDDTVEEPEAPSEPAASERENRKPVIEIEDRPAAAAEPENRGHGNAITGNVAAEGAGSLGSWWLALVVALAVAALVVGAVLRRK